MEIKEINKEYRDIAKAYLNVEMGYDNREQLQYWRQRLNFVFSELAYKTKHVSSNKISQEERKHVVRADAYARLEQEDAAKQGKKKSATALTSEVGNSQEYQDWIKKYSEAYGSWQGFQDFQQSVKLMIDSIASHLKNIAISDHLDPK